MTSTQPGNQGTIFVVSAPSGAGKTTLLKDIFKKLPELLFSVSLTTRKPRPGEKNGVDYIFCAQEDFVKMRDRQELAEWQEVHGNFYGTPIRPLQEAVSGGKNMVLDIDVYGKKKFDAVFPKNTGILILPPDLEELERRIRKRGTESEESIALRISNARAEMEFAKTQGRYEYRIVNSVYQEALEELLNIFKREGRWKAN
jgi:guanylate kinase